MENQYAIIQQSSPERLTEEVNAKIKEGWTPQGGLSIANGTNLIFAQAMILKK